MFSANPSACPIVQGSILTLDHGFAGPSNKQLKGKGKAVERGKYHFQASPGSTFLITAPTEPSISSEGDGLEVMQISSSDEDVELTGIGNPTGTHQGSQDDDDTAWTPPAMSPPQPKAKKQRIEVKDMLPTTHQQLGVLDIITTLRADTSFDGGIWAEGANRKD